MEGQGPATGPMVESKRPKAPYNFRPFYTLMGFLQKWRNADHEDMITLHRSQMIEIIDGVAALRSSLEEIVQEVGTSTKASMVARIALDRWSRELIDREPDHGQYANGGPAESR